MPLRKREIVTLHRAADELRHEADTNPKVGRRKEKVLVNLALDLEAIACTYGTGLYRHVYEEEQRREQERRQQARQVAGGSGASGK